MAEKEEKLVKMRVTRYYARDGVDRVPGEVIDVPEYAAESMEKANPPFGERVKDEPTPRKPAPAPQV